MFTLPKRASRLIAVDVGASHVACGVFSADAAGRLTLQEFAVEHYEPETSQENGWGDRTTRALGSVAAKLKLRGPAVFAIPGHVSLTKFIKMPSVATAKRSRIIPFEASQAIPYPLEEVVWDYRVVADDGREMELLLSAAKLGVVEGLCVAANGAGLSVRAIMPSSHALLGAVRHRPFEVGAPLLVADIGERSTTLVLAEGDRFLTRTVALAGNSLAATMVPEEFPAAPDGRILTAPLLQQSTSDFISRLQPEIARFISTARREAGHGSPSILWVTGSGSLLAGLPRALAEKSGMRVERHDPLRHIECSAAAKADGAMASVHLLTNLVGLACMAVADQGLGISLLPPAARDHAAFRRRQPWWLATAAVLALSLLPALGYYHRLARTTVAKAVAIEAQLRPLQITAEQNAANLGKLKELQGQIAACRRVVEAKSGWMEFLADLQERMDDIGDVWLDQLTLARMPASAPRNAAGNAAPELRLMASGRLLDVDNPVSKVSPESYERVKQLIASIAASPFVAAIQDERFDNSQPGLLRFDVTLVLNPRLPL